MAGAYRRSPHQNRPVRLFIRLFSRKAPLDLPDAIERVRPTIVQISVHGAVLGTGFFVDDQAHVITAKHVIDGGRELSKAHGAEAEFAAGMAVRNMENADITSGGASVTGMTLVRSFSVVGVDIVEEDAVNDLALLRMRANPFTGELPVMIKIGPDVEIGGLHGVGSPDPERPPDGVAVATSGYPLSNPSLVTSCGNVASGWLTDEDAENLLRRENPRAPAHVVRYLADMEVNGGNSGGPVYRVDTARVIGVCVATQSAYVTGKGGSPVLAEGSPLTYSSGLTVVVPSRYVIALLERNGVSWGSPPSTQPASEA